MAKKKKTGGRKKGTPNKVSGELKDMIRDALDKAGGVAYLTKQAKAKPVAFLALVGKLLPLTIAGDRKNPLNMPDIQITFSREPQKPIVIDHAGSGETKDQLGDPAGIRGALPAPPVQGS